MKYLKLFEELNKCDIKEEVDIIYRDSNLICLIPKTQRASHIYGHKTWWCSTKINTFDEIAEDGDKVLFRFLFKDGYKMRLSYDLVSKNMDWSDKSSVHFFEKISDDPFFITKEEIEREIFNNGSKAYKIQEFIDKFDTIPEKCREQIMDIIQKEKRVNYKFAPIEYTSPNIKQNIRNLDRFSDPID